MSLCAHTKKEKFIRREDFQRSVFISWRCHACGACGGCSYSNNSFITKTISALIEKGFKDGS